jgi:hypothetical protein
MITQEFVSTKSNSGILSNHSASKLTVSSPIISDHDKLNPDILNHNISDQLK